MRAPRKIYLVISKNSKGPVLGALNAAHEKKSDAQKVADDLNSVKEDGCTDWRVETYVKGD
jgi:hypothetical protein